MSSFRIEWPPITLQRASFIFARPPRIICSRIAGSPLSGKPTMESDDIGRPPWPWRSVSLALPTEHLSESIIAHCIIKDATTLLLVTGARVAYARCCAVAPERAFIPHALGHSAHLLRVGRRRTVARPKEVAATLGQTARRAGRTSIALFFDDRISMDCRSRCCMARLGTRIHCDAAGFDDSGGLQTFRYHRLRCHSDSDAAVVEPAAHGS